jgi:nickel-dependent lactate racemase
MNIRMAQQAVDLPGNSIVLRPPKQPAAKAFDVVVNDALDSPLDVKPLAEWDLREKKICILVDDWGRPTPAGEFLPGVLLRLNKAGADDDDITIVTASGMHDPIGEKDMERKVASEAYRRIRCVSHNGGDPDMISFVGITDSGCPVWVNRHVAESDFTMALGRVFMHSCYGYEGGYKMIVPGVASFETILRDHSLNFSAASNYGSHRNNPSRREADEIGRLVGIDFCVNFVINYDQKPVAAFGGTCEAVFPAAIRKGQHDVWADVSGELADITILSADSEGDETLSNNPIYYLGLAAYVTKPDGIIIADLDYIPRDTNIVQGIDLNEIEFSELIRLHERRDWNLPRREIQHAIKSIRGAFYYRRTFEMRSQQLFLACEFPKSRLVKWNAQSFATMQEAVNAALSQKTDPTVLAIPEGAHTLPLVEYDY